MFFLYDFRQLSPVVNVLHPAWIDNASNGLFKGILCHVARLFTLDVTECNDSVSLAESRKNHSGDPCLVDRQLRQQCAPDDDVMYVRDRQLAAATAIA